MPTQKYHKKLYKNNIEFICDEANDRVYKATYMINEEGSKDVLLIGRAPKSCPFYKNDRIIERTMNYLYNRKDYFDVIRKIVVVNLFAIVDYNIYDFKELLAIKGNKYIEGNDETFKIDDKIIMNDIIIKESISECDDILLAWGEPIYFLEKIYEERIEFVLKEIRKNRLESINKKRVYKIGEESINGYPKHPFAWNYSDELLECF